MFQFYIIESALELYARHMLFLTLSLEMQNRMGLQGERMTRQSRDERTEIHFFFFFGENLRGSLHRVGETGGKKRKGRIQKMLTDKDFPWQNDSRVCRGHQVTSNLRRVMPLVS